MTFAEEAAAVREAVAATFWKAATYTPSGGAAVAIRAGLTQPTVYESFGAASPRVVTDQVQIKVLATEVASPADGDTIAIDGVGYRVAGTPEQSPSGGMWALPAVKT